MKLPEEQHEQQIYILCVNTHVRPYVLNNEKKIALSCIHPQELYSCNPLLISAIK